MADWAYALLSGLAAGAQSGVNSLDMQIKDQYQANAEQRAADLKLDTDQRLLAIQDAMKQRAAERFMQTRQGMIDQKIGQKYAQSDDAVAAADAGQTDAPLTDDQKAVIAQAKQTDADKLKGDAGVNLEAGIESGTISPEQAATFANRSEIQQLKTDSYLQSVQAKLDAATNRTEMMQTVAQIRADAMRDAAQARLDAAREKAANGQVSASTKTMLINSENANIKAATSEMGMISRQMDMLSSKDPKRGELNDRIAELRDEIKQAQENKNSYMQDLGILKPKDSASGGKSGSGKGTMVPNPVSPDSDPLGLFKK